METEDKKKSRLGIIILILLLLLLGALTLAILFGRIIPFSGSRFDNVHDITGGDSSGNGSGNVSQNGGNGSGNGQGNGNGGTGGTGGETVAGNGEEEEPYSEFHMEADATIFRLSYDNETGKTTVIGVEGNTDKLIAPGTGNLYGFTLRNSGETSLDYRLTMEAYVTGTDLWLPVNARVWDYTNKYLVGSTDEMVDVMELNTVDEYAELGPGRYAPYRLEWEWPFEWGDDEYDTMLGNLAVDEDLVLHIVIRTIAWYDENPDNPNAGLIKPPQTGDDSQIVLLSLFCVGSFVGLCAMLFVFFKSSRKEKQAKKND